MSMRRSGVSVPLFSLRSTRSWGIGEIGDIPAFAVWMAEAGQSVLQILPLNALHDHEMSPYSALSAMATDPQFISIWMLPDAPEMEQEWKEEIDALRQTRTIDYEGVRRVKQRALRRAFERFFDLEWRRDTPEAAALRSYVASESWWLDDYSLFRALRAMQRESSWTEWPSALRDRDPAALQRARQSLASDILYFQYVQWIADRQWRAIRAETSRIQILGDFPFLVTRDSADVWSRRGDFMLDASVGTPPDDFSETGQDWGLPPYDWTVAARNGFEWLRMRTRRQAELYDGFRVDHLVGFYRTYVRPLDGGKPYFIPAVEDDQRRQGETLMRILMSAGADVSVEDLGTVPDFVRESIAALGLPGYKVLRWELVAPAQYPAVSVAMTGTHDTEPIAAWWSTLAAAERLRVAGTIEEFGPEVRDFILELMFHSGSNLLLVPLQDVFGWPDRINLPGTVSDANWTWAMPWAVDSLFDHPEACERAARLAEWARGSRRIAATPGIA